MAELFGMHYDKADLYRRVGSLEQIAGVREYTYNSGRADGVKAVEVNTGLLRFELLPSRCLDIATASYKGVPFGYFSKSGIRHPAYFSKHDPSAFLDNFFAGVLSTCGFNNIGPGRESGGVRREQHGELGNMPAEKVSVREEWDGDDCAFVVEGQVRHSRFYAEDMVLHRRVRAGLGQSWISIEDEVENRDFKPSPCLLLYHVQFGFPFLDASSTLITSPREKTVERPGTPEGPDRDFARFTAPVDNLGEICFYHTLKPDSRGWATACLFNPKLGEKGMGVYVRFDMTTLPVMVEWKMLRSREYVLGLEPATANLDERSDEEMRRVSLDPMEKRRFRLEIGIVEGEDACRALADG